MRGVWPHRIGGQDSDDVFTHEGNAGVHYHIQRRDGRPGVQPDERVSIPRGNVYHSAYLSIEVNQRIRNEWRSFRKYTLELYDRPNAPLELRTRMLRAEYSRQCCAAVSRGARVRATTTRCVSLPQLPDSLHRLAKEQSRRPRL